MPREMFKPILYSKGYEVSNNGKVRKIHNDNTYTYIKPKTDNNGFLEVIIDVEMIEFILGQNREKIYRKRCKLHKLIAEHFIPNPNNYYFTKFIDNNKNNVMASNLEWVKRLPHHYTLNNR